MKVKSLLPKKADIAVVAILLFAAAIFGFMQKDTDEKTVEIIVDGMSVYTENINASTSRHNVTLENGIVIQIDADGICFSESNCKNKDCVNFGILTKTGECAACLPNKTVITVKGGKKSVTDTVSY